MLKKSLLIILALTITLSSATVGLDKSSLGDGFAIKSHAANISKDYLYWAQDDSTKPWYSFSIASDKHASCTFGKYGCWIMSYNKMLIQCGAIKQEQFGPVEMINFIHENHLTDIEGCLVGGHQNTIANAFSIEYIGKETCSSYADANSKILNYVSQGNYYIIVRLSKHSVVIDNENTNLNGYATISNSWVKSNYNIPLTDMSSLYSVEHIDVFRKKVEKPGTTKLSNISNVASGIKVTWSKVTDADKYIVYRKSYNAKTKKWSAWSKLGATEGVSYIDKTAKSGSYYRYTVKASNEAGCGGYNTTGLKIKYVAQPKVSSVSNGSSSITVKWSKVSNASGYRLYRSTYDATTKKWSGWFKIYQGKGTSYTDKKRKSGTMYKYALHAYNGDYKSATSDSRQIKYLSTPSLKSVSSSKSGNKVTWNKVSGAKGYYVYRKTYSNGKWSGWSKIATIKSNSTTNYTNNNVKKGTYYKYTVKAFSDSYQSCYNTSGIKVKAKYTVYPPAIDYLRSGYVWYETYNGFSYYFADDGRVYTVVNDKLTLGKQYTTYNIDSSKQVIIKDFGSGENKDVYVTCKNGKLIARDYWLEADMFSSQTYELKKYTPKITSSNVNKMMSNLLNVYESCLNGQMGYVDDYADFYDTTSYKYITDRPYYAVNVPCYQIKANLEFTMDSALVKKFYESGQFIGDENLPFTYLYAGNFNEYPYSFDEKCTLLSSNNGTYKVKATATHQNSSGTVIKTDYIFTIKTVKGLLKITNVE